MIGFVIVTHGRLGAELIKTAEFILGKIEHAGAVSIDGNDSPDAIRKSIAKAVKAQDQGSGVIILTDMFGGTPSNISFSFMNRSKVEVLTGVNLPMIIKLVQCRENKTISVQETAKKIGEFGRKSINVAGEILGQRQD